MLGTKLKKGISEKGLEINVHPKIRSLFLDWGREYRKKGMERAAFLFSRVEKLLPSRKGIVLDLGCGEAYTSIYCLKYYPCVIGLDLSIKVLKKAKKKMKSQRVKGLNLINGDALKLPFKDDTFDVVLTYDMYEHIQHQDELLKEIYRVIKHGGILVLTTGNRLFPLDRHTMLWFIDYFPKKIADIYVKLMKRGNSYEVFQPTYWSLKKKIAKYFDILLLDGNSSINLIEKVYLGYFRKYKKILIILKALSKLGIFKFITPKFVVVSQKRKKNIKQEG